MKRWFAGALVVTALMAGSALAHEGGAHVRGVVKEVTAEGLVVATPAGEAVTIALTPGTRLTRGTTIGFALCTTRPVMPSPTL